MRSAYEVSDLVSQPTLLEEDISYQIGHFVAVNSGFAFFETG